jgi:hypothetical protein
MHFKCLVIVVSDLCELSKTISSAHQTTVDLL